MMKKITLFLVLISQLGFAQSDNYLPEDFLLEDDLVLENIQDDFNSFDFSRIWTQTQNSRIYGIIGEDHQRLKIKLTSVVQSESNRGQYEVSGKSSVKGIICDFTGIITITEVMKLKEMHYGVDAEYSDKGIKKQGVVIAEYIFSEDDSQTNSGVFKGKLYTKWYIDGNDQILYDDIQSMADSYYNNAFVGTWKGYKSPSSKICNWADGRIPLANRDFDMGAGEFSPADKYLDKGWLDYRNAWVNGDLEARKKENKEWWK